MHCRIMARLLCKAELLETTRDGSVEEIWKCFNCRTDLQGVYNFYFQIEVNGLVCAGKRIHDILIDAANAGVLTSMCKNAS